MNELDEFTIRYVRAIQVLDSRADPTVEVTVITEAGGVGRAIAPAGASRGRYEAVDLRDSDPSYNGRGVSKAVDAVNKYIAPAIVGMNSFKYREVDRRIIELDGTQNKAKLGGNACTATSLAVINAAADTAGLPLFQFLGGSRARTLPVPLMNVINGGAHAGNKLSIQEFMIAPVGADTFKDAVRISVEVYKSLKKLLKSTYGVAAINVGDEGGFAPPITTTRDALQMLYKAATSAGYEPGSDIYFALDAAASHFYDTDRGEYAIDDKKFRPAELVDYYAEIFNEYPVKLIEDPFSEDHPQYFKLLKDNAKGTVLVIGDDLTVTSSSRIKDLIANDVIDGAIIKVNQVGTFTEAEDSINVLLKSRRKAIVSHRSGDSEDVTIAHIAVGFETGLIKTGAPARSERTAKYNELLRIEDYLGGEAIYSGKNSF
ncbi:MAG: phosphopyruvate hydratase [Desulfurococcales archaeon]|nr:phosphopyruvate hydratase [Desulfurococcales archaeon]